MTPTVVEPKADADRKAAKAAYMKQWHEKNPDARRRLDLKKYGITPEQYDEMFRAQGGVCAACGKQESRKSPTGGNVHLHVDHDHETGRVRGLLCTRCNLALGYAQNDSAILCGLALCIEVNG